MNPSTPTPASAKMHTPDNPFNYCIHCGKHREDFHEGHEFDHGLRGIENELHEVRKHVEWVKEQGQLRVSQTRDSVELNAFNQGRVDAAESILMFWDGFRRQAAKEAR